METKFILVNSLTESLTLRVWDYNEHRTDTDLGFATFDLSKLEADATHENLEQSILKDGKHRGTVRFDVNFYPVLKPEVDAGGVETLPDTSESAPSPICRRRTDCRRAWQRSALCVSRSTRPRTWIRPSP